MASAACLDGYKWRFLADVKLGLDTYTEQFYRLILPFIRPEWTQELLTYHVFKSGVTNTLVAFYPKGLQLEKSATADKVVLLRINGDGTERIINRTDEVVAMLFLNQAGFCPEVYAQLKNGLCYGFSAGRRLQVHETVENWSIMRKVAALMAKLHSLTIPSYFKDRKPFLWLKMDQLLENVPTSFSDPDAQRSFLDSVGSIGNLRKEIKWVKELLVDCKSPIVLCHNDIHSANIIYDEETGDMKLVDYEYTGPNYFVFDIADHFCKFAGVENVDYNKYPKEDVQKRWVRMYLEEGQHLRGEKEFEISEKSVLEICADVRKLVLGCHLFWIVWSLFQTAHSTIHFDFMEYGILRFNEYLKRKVYFEWYNNNHNENTSTNNT